MSSLPLVFRVFFHAPAPTALYTFPYTTLFRSLVPPGEMQDAGLAADVEVPHEPGEDALLGLMRDLYVGDRKSTRLNSSHRTISYAVFCLKKKSHEACRPSSITCRQ